MEPGPDGPLRVPIRVPLRGRRSRARVREDGSADDVVLCLYDHLVGPWNATTIQAAKENLVGGRERVLFLARETNVDLNGDGDPVDSVVQIVRRR